MGCHAEGMTDETACRGKIAPPRRSATISLLRQPFPIFFAKIRHGLKKNRNFAVMIRNQNTGTDTDNDATVIAVTELTKRFGSFTAVDSISFSVQRGEIFGFLGANGAGKTTAMRMLCGLSKPSGGHGTVAGYDIRYQSEMVKKNIGYMSQKFSLYEDLKVWENVRLYAGIYGIDRHKIPAMTDETLAKIGLTHEKNTLVREIPLGWKQKLAFSVAISHRPRIVFLDEPTGGVDPITRRQFWELIYEASASGITVFVTTHYMDEAEYCNRVSIMVDGRIEALDTPAQLKLRFHSDSMDDVFYQLARNAKRSDA
jgi:ABC-2 type transport system ATP-binding protein